MSINSFESLSVFLKEKRRIVILTHWSPDGDAMGSSLGLDNFLKKIGHDAKVIVPNDYPEFLWWMQGHSAVINAEKNKEAAHAAITAAELIFCLDFNDLSRINSLGQFVAEQKKPMVMIDHHPSPSPFADYMLHDVAASSTCELIYRFIAMMNGTDKIDADIAECLYAGIMTDTGSFRFPSTTVETHRVVADLMSKGAQHSLVHNRVYDDNSESRLRLLGYALSEKLTVLPEFRTAFFTLTNEEHDRFNYKKGDTEGLVNYALTIRGIVFAAFFSERDGKVKCSFRSKGSFDVNLFARANFSGGGHRNAAGGASDDTLENVVKKFKAVVPDYAEQLKNS
ncbi:MAG: bifunctional oligoribonuclease/PAP phosphatase NrnA [Bacteroidia bacterium]|nr:bifunctional oligoribonuclease/PAP phosphatase NrnA [Bacteroidia bacterium]